MRWAKPVAWSAIPIYSAAIGWSLFADRSMGLLGVDSTERIALGLGFLMFTVVGAFLVGRRPDNVVGWVMVAIGTIPAVGLAFETYAAWVMHRTGTPDPVAIFGAWLNSWYWYPLLALFVVYLPLVFPDGRLISPRWRVPAVTTSLGAAVTAVMGALTETLEGQHPHVYAIPNPIGISGFGSVEDSGVWAVSGGILAFGILAGLASLVVRFRSGSLRERQQLKWILFPIAVMALVTPFETVPVVSDIGFAIGLMGMPVAIGIAVLRYRLYDIDRIVSRTVSYGVVTALLIGVYLGSVFLLRRLSPVEGPLAVAASTLAAAALFSPLRRKVQALVDRRFNRSRYDAERIVESFSVRLREEMDLADLAGHLQAVAFGATQPSFLSLWMCPDDDGGRVAALGSIKS